MHQRVAARSEKAMTNPHSIMAKQMFVRRVPTSNKNDKKPIASRKGANEAVIVGSSRLAEGSLVLYCVE